MLSPGLTKKERERLAKAGAAPRLADAVAREAETMRWLFLLRFWGLVVTGVLGFFATIWINLLYDPDGWLDVAVTALIPVVVGVIFALPHLEARSVRVHSPVRWAARRLAVLTVQGQPELGESGDEPWRELQRRLEAARDIDDPRAALHAVARLMERPRPKRRRLPFKFDGALEPNATNLNVLGLVAFALALSALVMMAVLKFS